MSDYWIGFTQLILLEEKPPDGFMWSGERLTRKHLTSRPDYLWPELWEKLRRNAELRKKLKWAIEKPKLDNTRRLRGIYFIENEDKSSRKSLRMQEEHWKHQWLLPCLARHARKTSMERPVARLMISNQNLRVSPRESTRMRMEESLPNYHEDHIAGRGDNSLQHNNLVHNFPMPQAMKIPAAKAAVDKEWEKLEMIPAWDKTKVRNKSEVIDGHGDGVPKACR